MRLVNILTASAVALMGLVSCVKEQMPYQDGTITFKASYREAPASKTVLQDLKPYWTPSDSISIYDGQNNAFANTLAQNSAQTSFKGKLEGQGLARKSFIAAYPYNENYTFSFVGMYVGGMEIPSEQVATEDSYDPKAAPAVAFTESQNLSFTNAYTLIKFRVISDGVTKVTVRGNADEVLSGVMNVAKADPLRLTVTQKNTNVSLCGAFKNGSTYYISAVPAVLAGGLKVVLNDEVVSMSVNAPVNLARSGIINLGDLSLDPSQSQKPDAPGPGQDDAVPCEWGIPGEHNGWSTVDPTPMYEVGSNFVAFDVPAEAAAGFKFKNGDTWIGTTSSVSLDTWVPAQGEGGQNIMFTAAQGATYDIYFANTLSAFYITLSGSPAPAPLPKPTTGITVAGTFNSWSTTADPAVEEGGYYTLKGIKAAMVNAADATGGDKGFKFVLTEANGTQTWFGAGSATVAVSQWHNANRDGGAPNIFVGGDADADYDVYLTKDMSKFCVVPAGAQIPENGGTVTPENPGTGGDQGGTYRFVVKVTKSIDWYDKYLYTWENGSPTLGSWPGIKMNWDKEEGNYYVYYYDFPANWSGRTINYIINNGNGGSGNQTQDLSVTLTGTTMTVTIETSHLQ